MQMVKESQQFPARGVQAAHKIVLRVCRTRADGTPHEWVTHWHNTQDGGFYNGHYSSDLDDAMRDFEDRVAQSERECFPAPRKTPLYRLLAQCVEAYKRCEDSDIYSAWQAVHVGRAQALTKEHMPSGSGWDNGTEIDLHASTSAGSMVDKLVFRGSFHHMNDGGMYDGWTDHNVVVRASLTNDFMLTVQGRNRNGIKDYLADTFAQALRHEIGEDELRNFYQQKGVLSPD